MSWWQERKARKKLIRAGIDKDLADETIKGLTEGYKGVVAARDFIRSQESLGYTKLIETLNQVKQGNAPDEQKRLISLKLVERSGLSDFEKHDLLQQLEELYEA